jgi:hypothetical protein
MIKDQRIVITVGKKQHGHADVVAPALQPVVSEATAKAGEEEARSRLAVIASLYRLMRGGGS